jgi:hypothetical protein
MSKIALPLACQVFRPKPSTSFPDRYFAAISPSSTNGGTVGATPTTPTSPGATNVITGCGSSRVKDSSIAAAVTKTLNPLGRFNTLVKIVLVLVSLPAVAAHSPEAARVEYGVAEHNDMRQGDIVTPRIITLKNHTITAAPVHPRDPMETAYFHNTYTVINSAKPIGISIRPEAPGVFQGLGSTAAVVLVLAL